MTTTLTQIPQGTKAGNRQMSISLFLKGLFLALVLGIFSVQGVNAQLSGSKYIPGDYATVSLAVTDLNTQGVGPGGVTFNIAAGYTETLTATLSVTATGTSADPIVFRKDPGTSGANPLITTYANTSGTATTVSAVMDGIWAFSGSDYVTIDGIDLSENGSNTGAGPTMEYGLGFFKNSATNGANNNTIQNCTITLSRSNNNASGTVMYAGCAGVIFINSTFAAQNTALTVTSAAGSNSNNHIYSNTIQNANACIYLIGYAATSSALGDNNNDIGGSSAGTGNQLINYGGGGTTSPAQAVQLGGQYNYNISYNTINNNNGSGVNHGNNTLRGIFVNAVGTACYGTISYNTVTLKGAGTSAAIEAIHVGASTAGTGFTTSISNNAITGCTAASNTTGIFYGIWNESVPGTLNVTNNTFSSNSFNTTTATTYLIYNNGAVSSALNFSGNSIGGVTFSNTVTPYSGTMYCLYSTGTTATTNVTFSNNTYTGFTHAIAGTGSIYFLYPSGSSLNSNITNNTWSNLTFTHSGAEYFMYNGLSTNVNLNWTGNSITGITRAGGAGTTYFMYAGSSSTPTSTQTIANNTVNGFTATLAGTGTFYCLYNSDGATSPYPRKEIYNNTFKNITNPTTGTVYLGYCSYLGDGSGSQGSRIYNNTWDSITTTGTTTYCLYNTATASPNYAVEVFGNSVSNITGGTTIYGSYVSAAVPGTIFYKNKISNITATSATGAVHGLYTASSNPYTIHNNLISDLKAPASSLTAPSPSVTGMNFNSGSTINAYYNSILLSSGITSSGTNWGSAGIYASVTPNVNLRNNIVINNTTPKGTGKAVAFQRSGTSLSTFVATSNNNIWYAGTPGAANVIFFDGTNADQTLFAYKSRVNPVDVASGTENVSFLSTAVANTNFLHVDGSIASLTESGASNISGITSDYDGDTRQGNVGYAGSGSAPDIGADEYNGLAITLAAPVNFASNTATTTSFNITWDDASAGEAGFLVYRSNNAGGPWTLISSVLSTTSAGTGTTYTLAQTGLLGGTTYYYQIYANNGINSPVLTGNASTLGCGGTMAGTYKIPTDYSTLTAAISALVTGGMSAPVVIELESTYSSATETFPIVIGSIPCLNATNTLTIRPEATVASALTITSANTTATIDINNGNYVTIDGRPGGTGTNKYLIIENTSATAGSAGNAVLIRNESTNNTLTYLDVKSANANPANNTSSAVAGAVPGAIAIGTTSGAYGNDNITISFCDIHNTGGTTPLGVGVYGYNANTAGSLATNDYLTITDCNIYDWFLAGAASAGINLSLGNNNGTITNNSIYQTSPLSYTGTQTVRAMWITPNTGGAGGAGFTISGNYIGGTAPLCGGSNQSISGSSTWLYNGMDLSFGSLPVNSVQGNVVDKITMVTANAGSAAFVGINFANGASNVGTTTGNRIGSTTTTGSISFATTGTLGGVIGIRTGGGSTYVISNNTVGGIQLIGSATTVAPSFNGIAASGGTNITISNNTVGSTTLANSIYLSEISASSTSASAIRGIICNSGGAGVVNTVTNNVVSNITSNYSAAGAQAYTMVGIAVTTGTSTISGNTISNLSTNTQTTGSGATPAVIGISYTSTGTSTLISGNTIHTLKMTNASSAGAIQATGLFIGGPSSGTHIIEKNNIHSLVFAATANSAGYITGMDFGTTSGVTFTVKNNMIRLGLDENGNSVTAPCTVRGITKNVPNSNIWNNSVYIGGSGVGTTATNTFALARTGGGTDDWRNNVLVNDRSNSTTGGKHYSINLSSTAGLTLNYNNYYGTGGGYVFGFNGADVAGYSTNWVTGDANSYSGDPAFINATGTSVTGDLHINPSVATIVEGTGVSIASVTDDFDSQTRSGLTPTDMGADAGSFISLVCSGVPSAGTAALTNNDPICFSGSKSMILTGFTNVPGISLQWKESAVTGGPYTAVTGGSGATTASYTTGTVSTPMYYICEVTCSNGGAIATSNEVSVSINAPDIVSSTPGTRCGAGTVTLVSQASAGATVRWYDVSTGGAVLATGDTLITPVISATTNFYAEASVLGSNISGGRMTVQTAGSALGAAPRGIIFTTTKALDIDSIGFMSTGAATTLTVALYNAGGTTIISSMNVNIPANSGTSTVPVLITVPVNFAIPSAGTYRFFVTAYGTGSPLYYEYSGVTGYPYAVGSDLSITASATSLTGTASLTTYYYFYKLNIKTSCTNAVRQAVTATVTAAPAFSVNANQTVCNGVSATLNVTSALANYNSYIWSPIGNLYLDALGTLPYNGENVSTVYAITTTAGSTTYTCSAADTITGCTAIGSSVVAVQPSAALTATASQTQICVAGNSTLNITPTANIAAGSIQWYSSNDNSSFTAISGATAATYAASISGDTTYYYAVINNSAGAACVTSNTVTVNVDNPTLLSTTPATRCGVGTTQLVATPGVGSSVNWYANATGGLPIATGDTLTTPVLSSTTTYYAAPTSGGVSGLTLTGDGNWNHFTTTGGFQTSTITGAYMILTVLQPLTLNTMDIYPSASLGTAFTIEARTGSASGTMYASWAGTTSVVNSGTPTVAQTLPVNWTLPIGTYYIGFISNPNTWRSGSVTHPFPYTLAGVASVDYYLTPSYQYYFYNLTFSTGCENSRVPVTATVTSPPAITVTGNQSLCVDSTVMMQVTSTVADFDVYTWSPQTNLFRDALCTVPYTGENDTVVYYKSSTSATTTYSVSGTDTVSGCSNVASTVVTNLPDLSPSTFMVDQVVGCNGYNLITVTPNYAAPLLPWYSNDFTSSTLNVTEAKLFGNAQISGGQLLLNASTTSQKGAIQVYNPLAIDAKAFQIDYDMTIVYGNGNADGFSYSFGDDIDTIPNSVTGTYPNQTNPENGSGSKLKLSFDSYANGSNTQGIYLMYNCTVANQTPVTSGVLAYSNNTSWFNTGTTTKHVSITIDNSGRVTVVVGGVTIFNQVQLPPAYLAANKSTWKHGFCARTGAVYQQHNIDNFNVQYINPNYFQYSSDGGATWQSSNVFSVAAGDTFPMAITYASNTGCVAQLGDAIVPAWPAAINTIGNNTSALCAYTPNSVILSLSPSYAEGATYQWESSPAGLNTWTPLTDVAGVNQGATTAKDTAYNVSANTDFRCVISCSGTPIAISPSVPYTVTVTSPVVTSTTPGTRCGVGTVNLSATSSVGTMNWYTDSTSATAIGTGSSFTTPVIASTDTFWVAANDGGFTANVGKSDFLYYSSSTGTNTYGIQFDATVPFVINTAVVYPNSATNGTAGTLTIGLANSAGTVLQQAVVPVTGYIQSANPTAQTVNLGFAVPIGTGYRLVLLGYSGVSGVCYQYSGSSAISYAYPFTVSGVMSITNSLLAGTAYQYYYYYFYNLGISVGCSSPRVPVAATVTTPPSASIGANVTICSGQSTTLTVTSSNDPDYSYVWNSGYNGASYSVNPSATTTYIVTATDTTAGPNAGCATVDTVIVNVNPVPATPTITQNPLVVCGNNPVTLVASSTQPGVAQIGTGTSTNATTGQSPFSGNYEGSNMQYLYTAAELNAAGIYAGQLTSLAFNVISATTTYLMSGYTIKLGATTATTLTAYNSSGMSVVYTALAPFTPVAGWNTYNFSSAFNWDGVSNILVEICHNNDPTGACASCWGGTSSVQSTTTTGNTIVGSYDDNTSPVTTFDPCSNVFDGTPTGNGGLSTNRPNIKLGYGSNTNFLWSTGGTDDTLIVTPPTGSTTYSVTATNTFGCTSSNSITVNAANPAQPYISTNDTSVCAPTIIDVVVADAGPYSGGYPGGTTFEWFGLSGQIVPATPDLDTIPSSFGSSYFTVITLPNGCTAMSDTAYILTKAVAVVDTIVNASCGTPGSIKATVTAGISPYQYVWSTDLAQTNVIQSTVTASNQDILSGLAAGTYYLSVSDEYGLPTSCNSGVITYVVGGANPINIDSTTQTNALCNGQSDGTATVYYSGGVAPISVLWSTGGTTDNIGGLVAGAYSVIVSDFSGCADTAYVTITEPAVLSAVLSSTPESAPGALDGSVTAVVSGGTPGYTIDWYDLIPLQVGSGATVTGLGAGFYQVFVQDTNACQYFDTVEVTVVTDITLNLTMYFQGMYDGVGNAPALMNSGVGVDPNECDTIYVELRDQTTPTTVLASGSAVLGTNGQASFTFPASVNGANGYIAVFHRNAVQTWSDLVTFSLVTNYNFTTAATQAFGSNMTETSIGSGIWAFYSGDLAPQDEVVDIVDQVIMDNDVFNFNAGYIVTDITGDGLADIVDQVTMDNNVFNFVASYHP